MSASSARRIGARLATAAVLSALLVPFGAGLLGGVAASAQAASKPKKGPSWKVIHTEKFSGTSLPSTCTPYTGTYTIGKSAWTSKDVAVSKGRLKLTLEKRKLQGKPYSAGGIACMGWAQKYGRYEVRAKVPAGKGIDSTIALWPAKTNQVAWTGLELLAPGPDTAYVTNGYSTKFERAQVPGSYAGGYHTYAVEWSPKQVRMTVDDKQIFYSTHSFNGPRWFAITLSNGDQLTGVPDAQTALPARLLVDQITVSSYTGVPPKAQPVPVATTAPAPSPTPTASADPAATTTGGAVTPAAVTPTAEAAAADKNTPALAGGVWPWLLGGSLIAISAIAILNYPGSRRARRAEIKQSDQTPAGHR